MLKTLLLTLGTLTMTTAPLIAVVACGSESTEEPKVETPTVPGEEETPTAPGEEETPIVPEPEIPMTPIVEIETDPNKLIQNLDYVNFNYSGYLDGEQFQGGTANGHEMTIGSGAFIPGFEDGMIGMQVGIEREIPVTFPDPYQSEDLAGKDVIFKVFVNAIWRPAEAIENGDLVNFDFAGYLDGVAFEGGTATGYVMTIGSGTFIPGFEEGMVGMTKNEERDINITFPNDYHSEDLAGKAVIFKVKVNAFIRRVS